MKAARLSRKLSRPGILVPLVAIILVEGFLFSACGNVGTIAASSTTLTTQAAATTAPVITATTTPATTTAATGATTEAVTTTTEGVPGLTITRDVPYMSQRSGWIPPLLDVYAPKEPGSWPVVVMFHGFSMRKAWLEDWATQVAQRGAVVYVPDWGHFISFSYVAPIRSEMEDEVRDIAAIVRFARATSADYGGDAGDLTLFGHSAGAGEAAVEALSGAKPSEGILAGAGSAVPNRLVLFDGDFILGDPTWDTFLAADPGFMQTLTPWPYLGSRVDFPITILASEDPGLSRPLGDPWAEDSWFVVRDPSGDVRQGLKKLGLLKGDTYTIDDAQRLLAERLSADGDQVSYLTLPSSTHTELSAEGMESLVSALVPNAER